MILIYLPQQLTPTLTLRYYKWSYASCYALCTRRWHWAEVAVESTEVIDI